MLALITGGAVSGKSAFAEDLAVSLGTSRLYIATMLPVGEDSLLRIEKHRRMRADKGFQTMEVYSGLSGVKTGCFDVVLLECLSNLLANEMFGSDPGDPVGRILDGIDALRRQVKHVLIVSGEIFSDGADYAPETLAYIANLGKLNRRIASMADLVAEVVCGIPVYYKGEKDLEKVY